MTLLRQSQILLRELRHQIDRWKRVVMLLLLLILLLLVLLMLLTAVVSTRR